jgi:hypothetical protein
MGGSGAAPHLYEATLGSENRFIGTAFAVGSREDLRTLAALPGAGPRRRLRLHGGSRGGAPGSRPVRTIGTAPAKPDEGAADRYCVRRAV